MPDNMNAREEFLTHIGDKTPVCANIQLLQHPVNYEEDDTFKLFILRPDFTEEEYQGFLESLNFTYDSGYGTQYLFGVILFEDSHSYRHEYDGAEWWVNVRKPSVEEVMNFQPSNY